MNSEIITKSHKLQYQLVASESTDNVTLYLQPFAFLCECHFV